MRSIWFRLNKWKTGWVPISWQGWLLTTGYIILTIYNYFRIADVAGSVSDTLLQFIPQTLIFTGFFSVLCYYTADNTSEEDMLK